MRNDVYGRIESRLQKIASSSDCKRYKPTRKAANRPQDIVAYAYLQADLKFASSYEKLDNGLVFQGTRVAAFGISPEDKTGREKLYRQYWVHDYKGREDFVVELASELEGHRLILARVSAGRTLADTIQAVEKRLVPLPSARDVDKLSAEERERALVHIGGAGDVLMIPRMAFDVERCYDELTGRRLLTSRSDIAKDLVLLDARQTILFVMNEAGVKFRSKAQMSFGCSASPRQPNTRWMVFDGPFLIMLQKEGASLPYYAAWIANAELLQSR